MIEEDECEDFKDVVAVIFNNWFALKIAVENGNPEEMKEKLEDFIAFIASLCCDKDTLDKFTLDDALSDVMDDRFNVVLEDNSEEELAALLYDLALPWVQERNLIPAINYIKTLPNPRSIMDRFNKPKMECTNLPICEMEKCTVKDGWTVVTHKK